MWTTGPGSVNAAQGGMAIGQVTYQRRQLTSRPVRLALRPALLAGREELLRTLAEHLADERGGGPRVAVLYGLGGAGKTSVAVEYAHRQLAGTGLVWQFQAGDPAAMTAGFADLAFLLGARNLLDGVDPTAQVHAELAMRGGEWLLIFDNALDAAALRGVLPPAGNGQVLITTQSPYWTIGQVVEVPVLETGIAAEFLMARTGDTSHDTARELASELGGLPLALEQAAAYMLASGRDIVAYLSLYRDRSADLLTRGDPAGYDKRVATTWSLAFAQLERHAPRAAALLRLLACCAPDDIPLRLLLQPRPGLTLPSETVPTLEPLLIDPLAVDEAITALRSYSLVSPPAAGLVSVHRLVQAVTLSQLTPTEAAAWKLAVGSLIEAALPEDPQQPASWPIYTALMAHAQAALATTSRPMTQISNGLIYSGSYAAANVLQQQILDACARELGIDHPDTLIARADFAYLTGVAGDAAAARDLYAALLPVRKRVSGPDHPDTLRAIANLARWTGTAGDAAGARDQFAELLPIRERVNGPDHPDTLHARSSLAQWTGAAGDVTAARDQLAALLPVIERVNGPEHPDALTDRANIAHWTGAAGGAAAARDQFAALLPIRERVNGVDHPDSLIDRANLAEWAGAAGDAAAARDQLAALLPVMERVNGPDHPDTLSVRASLALWTGGAGDAAAARDQLAALLPVIERVNGPEHPNTISARASLARWTGAAGNAAAARDQLAALLPVIERVNGPGHPETRIARVYLAQLTDKANRNKRRPKNRAPRKRRRR